MTIKQIRDELRHMLAPHVGDGEAQAMANIIIEDVKGYTPTQMVMYSERHLLDETVSRLRAIAGRIVAGEPMQYVLGTARFRGRDFKVDPSVLIPRPETAQLVDMIIDEWGDRRDVRVIDLGTGSGCIAVSLALDLPFAQVDAVDISTDAIATAMVNALQLRARVNAVVGDIFEMDKVPSIGRQYDIVVSNPPYILESEAASIDARVKDHEPKSALFVSDSHPIDIYIAIADFACRHLSRAGRLYLEINPLCADDIRTMLSRKGFSDVQIHLDYKGNKRFATATL